MNRREFISTAAAAMVVTGRIFASDPRYRIGYTTNTRGIDPATTWANDPFRGFREAHEVGFHYVEAFATFLSDFYPESNLQRLSCRWMGESSGKIPFL